ncbi:MAG: hypothetical protein LUE12_03590 [Ruminococcus sp.]|nr:hypothetical protein [Ruminococcus sp.]
MLLTKAIIAGKTTIVNCIPRFISKTSDNDLLDDEDVLKMGEKYREILSYQFQSQLFYFSYTSLDFLLLCSKKICRSF